VRVWDLATGSRIGDPLTGHTGDMNTVAIRVSPGQASRTATAYVAAGGGNLATVSRFLTLDDGHSRWQQVMVRDVRSRVLSLAWVDITTLAVATEPGIVVVDMNIG
jgi:hypothetical protein